MNRAATTLCRAQTLVGVLAIVTAMFVGSVSAWAASPPPYDGSLSFPEIHGSADPEEFSWTVPLAEGATLALLDEHHAEVFYAGGHPSFGITAMPAHDAVGTTVSTSLGISGGNVVTLTVHHRAGNPAAGGAPFTYPILEGAGWEGGFQSEIIPGPKDEAELREERERIERELSAKGAISAAKSGVTAVPATQESGAGGLPRTFQVEQLVKRVEQAGAVRCQRQRGAAQTAHVGRWRCGVEVDGRHGVLWIRIHERDGEMVVKARADGDLRSFVIVQTLPEGRS